MNKKKIGIRILVPVLIAITLIVIWNVKTHSTPTPLDENTREISEFELEATAIDLDVLTTYNLPIIIDFGSDSCMPCKQMAPALRTINEEMQGEAIIKFVDVWKNPDAANNFPVQVIPTQLFYTADGKPYNPSKDLGIEFNMYSTEDTNEHVFTVHQGGLTEEQMRSILVDMGVE